MFSMLDLNNTGNCRTLADVRNIGTDIIIKFSKVP